MKVQSVGKNGYSDVDSVIVDLLKLVTTRGSSVRQVDSYSFAVMFARLVNILCDKGIIELDDLQDMTGDYSIFGMVKDD